MSGVRRLIFLLKETDSIFFNPKVEQVQLLRLPLGSRTPAGRQKEKKWKRESTKSDTGISVSQEG